MKRRRLYLIGLLALTLLVTLALPSLTSNTYAPFNDTETISGAAQAGVWTGTITIIKDVASSTTEPTDFTFTDSIPSPCDIGTLDDDTGSAGTPNSITCANVPTGSYTVVENDPSPSFALTGLDCISSGDPGTDTTSTNTGTRTATVDLDAGETVTCTFTNTKQGGSITIIKDVAGGTNAQDFVFTDNIPSPCVIGTLDDDPGSGTPQSTMCSGATPGSYTVSETVPVDWSVTNISCSGDANIQIGGDGDFDAGDTSVVIDLDADEIVSCTFENTPVPPECAGLFNNPNPTHVYVTPGVPFVGGNQDQVVHGTSGDDDITGGNSKDCILGEGGNDLIRGQNGSDVLLGGNGDDTILGGEGQDKLFGEAGDDLLISGNSNDDLDGGSGSDVCDEVPETSCESEAADLDVTIDDDTPTGEDLSASGGYAAKITYRLHNDGPGDLTSVTFTGTFSGTATRSSASYSAPVGWTCSVTTSTWSCNGPVSDGQNKDITLSINGTGSAGQTVTFTPDSTVTCSPVTCTDGVISGGNIDGSDLNPADTDTLT